jgi:hypothetical protein
MLRAHRSKMAALHLALAYKYQTRVKVSEGDKHSRLLLKLKLLKFLTSEHGIMSLNQIVQNRLYIAV